jgi:homoserine O-acetyltransferase
MHSVQLSLARLSLLLLICVTAVAQKKYPDPVEGDYMIKEFRFASGESLPQLRMHYTTIGQPVKDASGRTTNAVLIMHGTTGSGRNFLTDNFAGKLFGPAQILDASRYFIILPDAIGHGKSSKPSDGMHMRFPAYNYDDMVKADYQLITEGLHINHLRLVMGTSMGGMHSWVWGYTYPDFMDALLPLASLPVEIAGRNRIQRKMAIDLIKQDPQWQNGEYAKQPVLGMRGAISSLIFMTSAPLRWQIDAPTRDKAEKMLDNLVNRYLSSLDANDFIYQFDASRDYNPQPHLEKIKAPLTAINSADDQVNPPELGMMEKEIKRVAGGRYVLLPVSEATNGHGTHSLPAIWGVYLEELMKRSSTPKK